MNIWVHVVEKTNEKCDVWTIVEVRHLRSRFKSLTTATREGHRLSFKYQQDQSSEELQEELFELLNVRNVTLTVIKRKQY